MIKKILLVIIIINVFVFGQSKNDILGDIIRKYDKMEDFQAKVKVVTDAPNFRMPIKTVQFFYKAPDKIKMKTKGFAILPKKGILPFMYLKNIYNDSVTIDTNYTRMVDTKEMTIISISDTSLLKIGKLELTIDSYLERVEKIEIINNQDTLSTIIFSYQNIDGYWMPEKTLFKFNLKKRLPKVAGPSIMNPFGSRDVGSAEDHFQNDAKVSMIFSDIKVNTGITDDFFE